MKACRAYYGAGNLICGLMEHEGDHWAAARVRVNGNRMTRLRFPDYLVAIRAPKSWEYQR